MSIFFNSKTPQYSWLSCFSPHPIVDNKKAIWPTAEHAYQAQKTKDIAWRTAIRKANHPAQAKRLGGNCPIRADWEKIKLDTMYRIQKVKFSQNAELRERLVETGAEDLIHEAPWDSLWGNGSNGRGLNNLGKILMRVRDEIVTDIQNGVYVQLAKEKEEKRRYY